MNDETGPTGDDGVAFFDDQLEVPSEKPGDVIGHYTLGERLGHGGFGTVWRADQDEPVKRTVALKIINLGMDTRQVVARFEQERQALALMNHPNVARVLDAGATATGRPYFVMDLVTGEPIGKYCDQNKLTVEKRLDVFMQVCNAVQHAHSKGIIHRDLKPSNVLVATQDGGPHATVIDFGIAKATSARPNDTRFTAVHQVIGTIYYMSPEQAEGSLDIDTRTDVYSLGAVLYELLTGTTPFDKSSVERAMLTEVQRLIREVEPPRPSARITASHDTLPELAATRGVEPARLRSILRGELDWIVMKALEKDRARRYETANALAMDIRRYLDGEPLVAAPPSSLYRLKKLVGRNKGAVAAVAAIAAALIAGVVGFAWQADVAQKERDAARLAQRVAESERLRAERNESRADAINEFLVDTLSAAELRNLGREAKVSQALDKSAVTVGTAFQDRPEVEAVVRGILARSYLSLGLVDQAEPHVERAVVLAHELHGDEAPEYARTLVSRATLARERGRYPEAVEWYGKAAEIARRAKGSEDDLALSTQSDYANALVLVDRKDEAEKIFRQTIATRRRIGEHDTREEVVLLNSLAVMLHTQKRLDEAEALYRESFELGERALGSDDPDTLVSAMNFASMLRSRGETEESSPLMLDAYTRIRKVFGSTHPKTAQAAKVLGDLYFSQGRFKDALPLFEECLAIRRAVEGERTEGVGEVRHSLALTLSRLGERARAVALHRESLEMDVTSDGPESSKAVMGRLDLANALVAADQAAEAEGLFKDLLVQSPRVFGDDHEITIIANNSYAVLLLGQERYAEAEPYLRTALEAGRRVQGADHRNTLITQHNMVAVLRNLDRNEEAESVGRDTVERFARVFGPRHANLGTARMTHAEVLMAMKRNEEAETELLEAIDILRESLGAGSPGITKPTILLAGLFVDTGRAEQAEPLLREAVEIRTKTRGKDDRSTAGAKARLGQCLTALERFSDAEQLLLEAHTILAASGPGSRQDLARSERGLADLFAAWNAAEPDAARAAKAAEWEARAATRPSAASKPASRR